MKPMLASKIKNFGLLRYPLYASPKLDGIRALTSGGQLLSRNLKPIANSYIQSMANGLPDGLDGELILNDGSKAGAPFNETSSAVMAEDGRSDVKYHVFDYVTDLNKPANRRLMDLIKLVAELKPKYKFLIIVMQEVIDNEQELLFYEQLCIADGYEGIMIKSMTGIYKEGRSTEREGYLLKLKRFEDGEAKIIGFEEKMHNANEATEDLLGHTKRSQAKAGKIPAGTLGKIYVYDLETNIEFEIGTGFDDVLRQIIWDNQDKYLNKIVKYKHQLCGAVEKPRFPVFLGFRDRRDMS